MSIRHSVRLEVELRRGCIYGLKTCTTEVIRVKNGKAFIIEEKYVDCGACIRRCPFRAKKAHSDALAVINDDDFTVTLPAPGLGETPAADGIQAVLEVLEALEDDRLEGTGFVELMVCPGGCVGGPLLVENPFLARSRIRAIEEEQREGYGLDVSPEPLQGHTWRFDEAIGDVDPDG